MGIASAKISEIVGAGRVPHDHRMLANASHVAAVTSASFQCGFLYLPTNEASEEKSGRAQTAKVLKISEKNGINDSGPYRRYSFGHKRLGLPDSALTLLGKGAA